MKNLKKKPAKKRPGWKPGQSFGKRTVTLRRQEDNSAYGYRCEACNGAWKIYQNPYHQNRCSEGGF
tara:strand:+ start:475 stop:672 length:198 start_codon:yes stop_codon:yes gene_type:complete